MKSKIELALRVFLGIVFLISAYSKFISPGIVEIILVDQGLVATRDIAALIVRTLIAIEFTLGVLFFQPYSLKKIVIPISFLFLVMFTGYLVYTGFILRDTQNCGCFGEMIKMSPIESIIKNIVLIILLFILYKVVVERENKYVAADIVLLSVTSIFLMLPIPNQKEFKFSKYTYFEDKGRTDLSYGDKLIAVLNTECDHCQVLAKELAILKKNSANLPEVYTLFFTEGNVSVDSFKVLTGFQFPYRMIEVNEFFSLIGQSPPRIYWLQNGITKEMWDKNIFDEVKIKLIRKN